MIHSAPDLLAVARGDTPADLVIQNARVVNVFNGTIEDTSVALAQGVIAGLGDYQGAETFDAGGAYLLPGFIEGHLHIESSFLIPAQLARAVAPHGTAAIVADPHEIANVMGLAGVRAMLAGSGDLPVDFFFMAPSCVPATNLETSGATLQAHDLAQLLDDDRVLGLAEVMNFPGTIAGDPEVLAKLEAFAGRPIDGHAPLLGGKGLNAYLAAGAKSDHECTLLDEAAEKLARGMWIMIREGTNSHDMAALLPLVNATTERRCMLVSDDRHPDYLANQGHLDELLRKAVGMGLDPMIAVRLVTLNPARRFGLHGRGALAPGCQADLVLVEDLKDFRVKKVWHRGVTVDPAQSGNLPAFAPGARDTMRLPRLSPKDFAPSISGKQVRVIGLVPGSLLTESLVMEPPQKDGRLMGDPARDLALLAVVERHQASGNIGHGLLKGLGLKAGALASSVSHDSHNLVVAGVDPISMLTAAKRVGGMRGGLCVAQGEEVLAELPLPIAGLMSDEPLARVVEDLANLRRTTAGICDHAEPFMPLAFVALPVIPHLKLSDQGLVDGGAFALTSLFVD